ncbi:MAG: LamG-like jellyroll fold domain-containing protein [Nitrospirota bacterium]
MDENEWSVMMQQKAFTLIELVSTIVILGLLSAFVIVKYIDLRPDADRAVEINVVGAVKTGISNYNLHSSMPSGPSQFPAVLDNAANGDVSSSNPFFTIVLTHAGISKWSKSGLSYLAPSGSIYTYDPLTGTFDTNAGLVSDWSMNEGSGTTTGQGAYQGSIIGNAVWTSGKVGDALHFDGVNSRVSIPDSPTLDLTTTGTVGAWINMDSIMPFGGIIHKGDQTNFSDESYTLQFWTGNTIILGITDNAGTLHMVQTNTVFSPNTWYNVVGTWDSTGMKIYVNGVLDKSVIDTGVARNSAGHLNIGAQMSTYPFQGVIDEATIHNSVLTPDEIKLYYNSTK